MEVIIIGGGAAGMAAAIECARRGAKVTVLEKMDRVGKKLLATGNGRCNLMNTLPPCYPGGADFACKVLARCGATEQAAFWQGLGLRLRQEEGGRVYPVSGQASTVLDTLRLAMDQWGVRVITGVQAEAIRPGKKGVTVLAGAETYRADKVIVTGGGCAQPKLGSDGSAWKLLTDLGHRLVQPRPALTQIVTDAAPIKGLSGIRVKAEVSVRKGDRVLHEESGEVLFADYGLSGVCVMQCARFAGKGTAVCLNFLPGMGFAGVDDAAGELHRRKKIWRGQMMENLLTGLCVPRLAGCLCQRAGIVWKGRRVESLTEGEIFALAETMHCFRLTVKDVKGFDSAQVTAGGLALDAFDPETMGSRLVPNVYAAGEILDVDGTCGGYNLMFAFGSGILAARACTERSLS